MLVFFFSNLCVAMLQSCRLYATHNMSTQMLKTSSKAKQKENMNTI
ncbi:unnamed protein product [Rhodiola kirilowii]